MGLTIRLLGVPRIVRDGVDVAAPRGQKPWGLLAYVLLADRPVSRQHLAERLFPEADDPLGTLRWTLTALRRALGCGDALRGDPLSTGFAGDDAVEVDVLSLSGGEAAGLLQLGGDLLEGVNVAGCPLFQSWLVVERCRLSAVIEARLRRSSNGFDSRR